MQINHQLSSNKAADAVIALANEDTSATPKHIVVIAQI